MPGSTTTPGRPGARGHAPVRVAFRQRNSVGTREDPHFRGSMADLCAPRLSERLYHSTHSGGRTTCSLGGLKASCPFFH
jgi:hypothetical protein